MRLLPRVNTPVLFLVLLLSPGNGFVEFTCIAAAQGRRVVVPRQDHEQSAYYAMHLHPDVQPEEIATLLDVQYEGQIGELEGHYLFSRPRDHDVDDDGARLRGRLERRGEVDRGILYIERQRTKR